MIFFSIHLLQLKFQGSVAYISLKDEHKISKYTHVPIFYSPKEIFIRQEI